MGELRSTQNLKTLHDYVVLITTANFSLHMLQGNSTRILTLQSAVGRLNCTKFLRNIFCRHNYGKHLNTLKGSQVPWIKYMSIQTRYVANMQMDAKVNISQT